jgi:hypothetical protein
MLVSTVSWQFAEGRSSKIIGSVNLKIVGMESPVSQVEVQVGDSKMAARGRKQKACLLK